MEVFMKQKTKKTKLLIEILSVFTLVFLILVSYVSAETLYVNNGESIQTAIDSVTEDSEDDTIIVNAGNYNGFVVYKNNITVKAADGASPVINGYDVILPIDDAPDAPSYIIVGASRVTIDGFSINGYGGPNDGVDVGILISGNKIITLAIDGSTRTTKGEAENVTIINNSVTNMEPVDTTGNARDRGYGLFINGGGDVADGDSANITVLNNTFSNNHRGIGIYGDVGNTQIHYNKIANNDKCDDSVWWLAGHGIGRYYKADSNQVHAENNWWGNVTGLSDQCQTSAVFDACDEDIRADGSGDEIFYEGGVCFYPWCTNEECEPDENLYVNNLDQNCDEKGMCTEDTPCCSIQAAIDLVAVNQQMVEATILVSDGNYDGFIVYEDNITIKSADGKNPEINGTGIAMELPSPDPDVTSFVVVAASNTTVDDLNISGTLNPKDVGIFIGNNYNNVMKLENDGTLRTPKEIISNVTVINNIVSEMNAPDFIGYGLFINGLSETDGNAKYVSITNNTISNTAMGIGFLGNVPEAILRYNKIYGSTNNAFEHFLPNGDFIDARYNWWGAANGPSSSNPENTVVDALDGETEADGDGDTLFCNGCGLDGDGLGGISFYPWCTNDACETPSPEPEPDPAPDPGPTPDTLDECNTDADCDDKNPCTNDSCTDGLCIYSDNGTATCDDGLFCTVDDTCVDGECVGTARDCDDGNFCTGTESCDEAGEECVSSGDPCEEGEECSEVKDACLLPPVPGELSLTPDSADLVSEQSVNFTAECTGDCEEPDYEWSVDSNIGSIIDQDGNYVAGINTDCSEVATDVIVVEDNANGLFAEAEMTVSCDRIIGVTNISNPLWLLNPTAISSSHFLPLFKMLFIHAENGGFDKTSVLSFEPAENINVLGKIAKGNNLLGFVIVKPNAEECLYRATIETGSHMVTKKEALNMSLLPWILEE